MMQGTNVLFGQIAVVFGIVIAGVWSATQWTAAALGYQLRLGSPWFDFFGTPVYHPWRLFEWWFVFDAYAPRVFDTGGAIAGGSGLLAVVVAIGMSIWRSRQSRLVTTYGSARWANADDIRKAGLTQPTGVFLGQHDHQYLRHEGPEHILTFAPTRSGKGVGLVVPTLLSWPASAVIHDIKGENWQITAGWRSRFSHCLLFNPTDSQSAAYNPLLEVRRGVHEVRDVQNIADILVDPEGALEKRNHWEKTSHALLVGAILHVLYAGEDKTLCGVANFLSDPACPFELTLHRMMTTLHLGDRSHPVVASAAREVLNKSDNERSGVLSTAMSFLGLYRDPTVAEVTSRCDWRIADLIAAEHPVSLYLVVPPSDISRTKPLIRLILNQIGRRLTESLDGSDGIERRHKLLLMLDEFPALGRLDFFETALAFMAGYGIRSFLIAQSLNQIDKAYGQNHSILDNCHVRVTFATNDERTAKRISETLGTATELRGDFEKALSVIPGNHRFNLHACYAEMGGKKVDRDALSAEHFAAVPLLVLIDGTSYTRSIQKANPDGSLTFFCAIEEGIVMRVAQSEDILSNIQQSFADIREQIGQPGLTIGFDCILRKLENQRLGLNSDMSSIFQHHHTVGLNTYGEQYCGVHVTQTLTGVAIGDARV